MRKDLDQYIVLLCDKVLLAVVLIVLALFLVMVALEPLRGNLTVSGG